MTWYWKLTLYLSSLLLSAIVGGFVKIQLDKASLNVTTTSITLSAPTPEEMLANRVRVLLEGPEGNAGSEVNPELKKILAKSTWISSISNVTSIGEYIGELVVKETELRNISNALSILREGISEWPKRINETSISTIYRIFRANAEIIQGHIFGQINRNHIIFNDTPVDFSVDAYVDNTNYNRSDTYYYLEVDDDGDMFLSEGVERLPIIWSTHSNSSRSQLKLRYVAWRLVRAIQTANVADLLVIKNVIESTLIEEPSINTALKIVREELERFSYWMITASIANNGSTPVAISPNAALYIKSRGYLPKSVSSSEELNENIRIPLKLVESTLIVIPGGEGLQVQYLRSMESPIVVEGGKALSVKFRSLERIHRQEAGGIALEIFQSGGVNAVLAIVPLTATKFSSETKPALAEEKLFRELSGTTLLPLNLLDSNL